MGELCLDERAQRVSNQGLTAHHHRAFMAVTRERRKARSMTSGSQYNTGHLHTHLSLFG
jgi:hypothetical protein